MKNSTKQLVTSGILIQLIFIPLVVMGINRYTAGNRVSKTM